MPRNGYAVQCLGLFEEMHEGFSHLDGFQHWNNDTSKQAESQYYCLANFELTYRIINMTSFTLYYITFVFLPSSDMNFDTDSIVVTLIFGGRWLFEQWTNWGHCIIKVLVISCLSFANVMLGYIILKNWKNNTDLLRETLFFKYIVFLQDLKFFWIGHISPHSPHLFPLNIPANICLLASTKRIPWNKLSKQRNTISMTDINLGDISNASGLNSRKFSTNQN